MSSLKREAQQLTAATSDLNESQNKSSTVFKESAADIDKWASNAARAIGQSKRQALDAAGGFGNMFNQLGIGSQTAATMSKKIVELGSDFASFHNADISQVLEAQSAAFRGEYDALQRFLPLVSAATVEQKAMSQTGKQNAKDLTAQEKALAVYALMLEGAGEAQGDFAKTAGGAANQSRILAAVQEDLAAKQGRLFLPAQIAVNKALLEMPAPLQAATFGAMKFGPALAQTTIGLLAMGPALGAAGKSLEALRLSALASTAALGPLGLLIVGTTAGYIGYEKAVQLVTKAEQDHQKASTGTKVGLGLLNAAIIAANVSTLGAFPAIKALIGGTQAQGEAEKDAASATTAHARSLADASREAGGYGQKITDVADKAKVFNQSLNDASAALAGFGNVKTPELLKTEAQIADIDKTLANLNVQLDEAKRNGNKVLQPVDGGAQKIRDANIELMQSYQDLTKAVGEYRKNANPETQLKLSQAENDYRKALDGVNQARANSVQLVNVDAEALKKQIAAAQEARDTAAHHRDAIVAETNATIAIGAARIGSAAALAGEAKGQADLQAAAKSAADTIVGGFQQAKATMDQVPASTDAIISHAEAVPPSIAAIGQAAINQKPGFDRMAADFHADTTNIINDANKAREAIGSVAGGAVGKIIAGQSASVGHNAGGTGSWRGGWTWVGERGPELISLPSGTKIYSNPQSQQIEKLLSRIGHNAAGTVGPGMVGTTSFPGGSVSGYSYGGYSAPSGGMRLAGTGGGTGGSSLVLNPNYHPPSRQAIIDDGASDDRYWDPVSQRQVRKYSQQSGGLTVNVGTLTVNNTAQSQDADQAVRTLAFSLRNTVRRSGFMVA